MNESHYPVLKVNLDAMAQNAKIFCGLCAQNGISVAGIINHLRLGGTIANPMNIRLGRGLTSPGHG